MKDVILTETGVDIDQYFKADLIATLKSHYEKKLRLTPEEMSFHLPRTVKVSNQIYETKQLKTQHDDQQQPATDNANYLITPQQPILTNVTHIVPPMAYNPNVMINPTNFYPTQMQRSVSPDHIAEQQQRLLHHHYIPKVQNYNVYQP